MTPIRYRTRVPLIAASVVSLLATSLLVTPPASGESGSGPGPGAHDRATQKVAVSRLIAVGDIACDPNSPLIGAKGYCQQNRVGRLVTRMVDRGADWFVTLGDAQYEYGRYRAFRAVFDPAFRKVRPETQAVAGNHEYYTAGAKGHFRYWGRHHAGTPHKPWRTFTPVRGWRVLLLDSNCEYVGGCGPHSRQGKWIRGVMRRNTRTCTVAMWHHPLQTSGEYAGDADTKSRARKLWHLVNDGGADLVLNGHDHIYERFAKRSDIQQFTVGTGGKSHYSITTKAPGSRKRIDNRYGVLRLDLRSDGTYRHAFVTVNGNVIDRGHKRCTNKPN